MIKLAMFSVVNAAVLGSVGYAQYNLVDATGLYQKAGQTTRTSGLARRAVRGSRMGRSGSRSRHK